MDPAVEQAIEQDVTNFLNAQSGDMPQNYPWDFRPMIRSIAERNFKIAGFFNMPPRPAAAPAADSFWVNHVIGDDRPDGPPTFQPESIYRKPGGGSWDWVWYIPEWSHPDFHPDIARTYSGSIKYIGHSDPLSLMRPALRTADRVRAPTEWAKRFGIHPDELGGRSRLSPTLSSTRDPFEDFANQVNRLSEEETKQAIQLTKEAANRAGVKLPDDPNYIDPMVMEEMLSQHGLMSGAELKESLKEVMGKTDNIQNLDALVEVLNERNPEIYKAHQTFLHNALRDQDYQRLVFHEMTTDELVSGNVLTMSNDAKCDLQGEIHPLFDRDRWTGSSEKGTDAWNPRYVYNLNGKREEWDVTTNDTLWKALRPALLLASNVLRSESPIMQSLMDLRTRQPIPPEWDNRPMEERKTTHLTRIVPIDKIDMNLTYPQIRYLDTWGLRWPEYSWRLLSRMLRLNIGSCWISPVPTEDQGASDEKEITYGLTQIKVPDQNSPYVRVQIAAELIWPLLVPEYSQTEKMTASFVIAATLLHEFGHAINHAQYLLMWEPGLYLEPIHFNVTIVDLLQSLRRELFDFVACKGEQFYGDEGEAEHGFVVEKQLLGGLAMNLMSNPMNILSRQIVSLPLMVEMCEWPQAETPVPASRIRKGAIRNPRFPVECYCMPLPIDYMTKFFTQKFWDIDFKRYGQEAFKMLPANRIHKTTMNPVYMRQDILMQAFGKEQWSFVKWVSEFFSANNHRILGEYIRRLLFQALGQHAFVARWLYEVGNWDLAVLAPLNTKVTDLNKAIEEAGTISARHLAPPAAKDQYYFQYVTQHQSLVSTGQVRAGGLMTREQWYERLQSRWTRRVRVGGVLMVGASEVCRLMTAEIAYMERMIFDFFSLNPAARASVRGGGGGGAADQDPIAAARGRMLHCRAWAFQLATWLEELTNVPPLQIAMPFWYQWISRLRYCGKMYHDLLAMLGEEQIDPNDNSWKKRFATVPSSFWKNRVDRIQVLAQKEYLRADPRVRAVVDECLRLISQAKTPNNLNPEFSQPDIQKVTEVINKSIALGKAAPTTVTRNMFKWTYPDQPPPPPPPPATLDQASQEDSTKPQNPTVPNIGGIVFGKPSELGARPPLRLIGSSTKSGSGVERGSKSDNDRDASGALGPAPGGGVKNTGKANKSPSRGVKKNVKSTLNWRGADKSKGFLEGAAKMGVLSTIHELGVPSTTIRGILKSKSSGPTAADSSAPTQTSQASFSFGVAHGDPAPAAPFPSPWADMFTLTADHEYTTKFREEMAAIDVLLNLHGSGPPQPYKTAGPWRETREDSPNDDEPNNLGDPNNGAPPNDGGGPDNGAPPNDGDGPDNGGGNGQPLDGDFGNPQAMDEADLAQLDQEIEDFLQQNTDMTVDNNDNDDI